MLQVKKRDGRLEPFFADEPRKSLAASSDEAHMPLTQGDIDVLMQGLYALLEEKTTVTSKQLSIMLVGLLVTGGFPEVATAYMRYVANVFSS